MPRAAVLFGVALSLVGIAFYLASRGVSVTALIPTAIGLLLVVAGALARRERLRPHAMHAAALVGTLGLLGCLPGVLELPALLSRAVVPRPLAVVEESLTAALCLVFVALCVRSFVRARLARTA